MRSRSGLVSGAPRCPTLIGRDDLVTWASDRLTAARHGTGGLLLLAGEAGIGKTRLLTEAGEVACRQGVTVVEVGAYPRGADVVGGVLTDLAAALLRTNATAGCGALLAQRLGTVGDGVGDTSRLRRLLVADAADLIVGLGTGTGPVLLALEDLHWYDELTLEVLDRVARRLATVPLLVVATYRSDELYPKVPLRAFRARMLTQRLAEEVRLDRLDPAGTAAMAAAITGAVLPGLLTDTVHQRSDGIPLHIEEFLAFLTASSATGSHPTHPAGMAVPDTLADAVLARAEALSEPARALADAASVLGRSFDLDLLTAVSQATPEVVDAGLRELAQRFLVEPRAGATAYDFRHALIRDVLYADLPPHRRRALHARAAAAAGTAGLGDAFVSDQYEQAGAPALAYRHARAAADTAAALSAHREAVDLYRRARRTMPRDTPVREQADLLAALAAEAAAVDDNEAAASAYAQAQALYRQLGDDLAAATLVPAMVAVRHLLGADIDERDGLLRDALALIDSHDGVSARQVRAWLLAARSATYMLDRCLDDSIGFGRQAQELTAQLSQPAMHPGQPAIDLNIDATVGSVLVFSGQFDEGWRLLEAAIHRAEHEQLEAEAARGYRMLSTSASVLVEYDRAERWLGAGIAYAERTERFNDRHYMSAHLAHVRWATGDWTAADAQARQALADGRGGVTTRITALYVLGYLALGRGDWTAANGYLHEAWHLGERMAELQRLSPALWGLAETALHSGNARDAVTWCERGYAGSAPAWDAAYLFPYVVTGVRAHLALDDPTAARDWLARCTTSLLYRNIPGTLPALDHGRGLLHLAEGQTARAREALGRAGNGWDARRRFWEGTQVLLDRAAAAHRSHRPAEAAALDSQARHRADRAGATTLLAKAGPDRRASGPVEPLTAREIEVARLIATGATNREAAQALSISPKTVAAHVEHILTKLGAARRTEIAAWATARTASTPLADQP